MSQLKYYDPEQALEATVASADANSVAGALLADLERRQDEVISELDSLNRRIEDVLRELGVNLDDPDFEISGGKTKGDQESVSVESGQGDGVGDQ